MFVADVTRRIELWKSEPSPFVREPLSGRVLTRAECYSRVKEIALIIESQAGASKPVVGFCFDSPVNWVLTVLATQFASGVAVPIPREFTQTQIASFVPNLEMVLTDSDVIAEKLRSILGESASIENREGLFLLRSQAHHGGLGLPINAIGVIHTSGSTDNPKGVVISEEGLLSVTRSMGARLAELGPIHYASLLPMSLLLEQVLGVWLPLFSGGTVSVLPRSVPCYTGTQVALEPYLSMIRDSRANFSMVPPSFIEELVNLRVEKSSTAREFVGESLQVLATGGAPIEAATLQVMSDDGLEVFQGYGLSENTSVVSWTFPGPNVLGSVGRPLEHNEVRINEVGKVEVNGSSVFMGYVSSGRFKLREDAWLHTGDHGFFDEEGCLHISGRESNLIVLSSGRNVSPEWVEGKFKTIPSVKEVLLVGHGRPFLAALVLVNKGFGCEDTLGDIQLAAEKINCELPEFSRIQAFRTLPFDDRYYSVSGRVLRYQVLTMHKSVVEAIYTKKV